jgi:exonuclease III
MAVRIATWNLEWAKPGTERHDRALVQLSDLDADVVVTTEDSTHDWEEYPYRIDAGPDWGYPRKGNPRKVIAWSRTPWTERTELEASATRGRFVGGVVQLEGLAVTVLAVCVPWRDSHVRTGRRDAAVWAEHLEFCAALRPAVNAAAAAGLTVAVGDFNQRIPRTRQPPDVASALVDALGPLQVPTAGEHTVGRLIDHVAVTSAMTVVDVTAWSNVLDGHRLSDHAGVAVTLDLP